MNDERGFDTHRAGLVARLARPLPAAELVATLAVCLAASGSAPVAGAETSDGNDMLEAQIALSAGFAADLPAGEALGR